MWDSRFKSNMSSPTLSFFCKLFLFILTLGLASGFPQLITPTQVDVSNNVTSVIEFHITSPIPNATVNITGFTIDSNYAERDELATFIVLAGGTTLNITEGAPKNLTGVTIVLHFNDGTNSAFGTFTLIIRGPNEAPILSDTYSFSIPENSANEYLIGNIDFTDEIPNSVTFTSSLSSIFGFQPNTNRIVVLNSAALDRETKDMYTFMINATDSEGLQSSANVTVTLTDVNDQVPVINNTESELYRIIIQSSPNGYSLVNISARDGDEGANSEYSFSLYEPSLPFSISDSHLYVNGTLEAKTYSVVIIVTDKGMPPLSSNSTVTVQVEPRNDFSPSFVSTPYTFSFLENSNGSVFTFSVTDGDTGGVGSPGSANLSLANTSYSSSFSVTASHETPSVTTGYLTVLSPFDREALPTFNLTIVAFDTGYPQFRKTSETNVVVEVSDANDHPPFSVVPTVLVNDGGNIGVIVVILTVLLVLAIIIIIILILVMYIKRANIKQKRKSDNDIVMECSPAYATTEFKTNTADDILMKDSPAYSTVQQTQSTVEPVYDTTSNEYETPLPPSTEYEILTI